MSRNMVILQVQTISQYAYVFVAVFLRPKRHLVSLVPEPNTAYCAQFVFDTD